MGFQPNITFIEPAVQQGEILAQPDPELATATKDNVINLANTINILATAIQVKVDDLAKDVEIHLDEDVDAGVIAAMDREYPDADSTKITYQQYRKCKDHIRAEAAAIAQQVIITPEAILAQQDCANKALKNQVCDAVLQMGGNATPAAKNGLLRPELDKRAQIIKPIKLQKLQVKLVCILANFIWKNFLLKALDIKIAGAGVRRLLPKTICKPGSKIKIPDLLVLGQKKKKKSKFEEKPKMPKLPAEPKAK